MDAKMETSSSSPAQDVTITESAPQRKDQAMEALKDITCGSLAGIVGKFVEYPFDTVKVRLQSQPEQYRGPLDCFRQSLQHEGFRGLYRGVSAPLLGAAAENACLFWSYRIGQDILRATIIPTKDGDKLPMSGLVAAGAISGGVTSLVLTPIELVKCRMQVPKQPASPLKIIADVWRHDGLMGFWRGQLGTLVRETGGSAAWFGTYEMLSLFFKSRLPHPETDSQPLWQPLLSGAAAGMSYNFICYPADTIKSTIQTGEFTHVKRTFLSVGREIWLTYGIRGLYRGCGITVARSAPSSALIFTIYDKLREKIG